MLSEQDIETVKEKLSVPLVVSDILESQGHITAQLRYGLHEAISDFQPDSALLCFATSLQIIAASQPYPTNGLKLLSIECERLIEDYAPLWLENINEEKIDQTLLFETLMALPEDLEMLSTMMAAELDLITQTDPKAAELFDILIAQAHAHTLIAAEYVEAMGYVDMPQTARADVEMLSIPAAYNDNVIPFPGTEIRN